MTVGEQEVVVDVPVRKRRGPRVCVASPEQPRTCLCPAHFERVIAENLRLMLGRARCILGSDDLAWDAVQEVLLALWHEPEVPPNPRAWLLRAVTNRGRQLARGRSRRRKYEEQSCGRRPEASRRDEPTHALEDAEFWAVLDRALAELSQEHRSVFVLYELEALDYETIAERLFLPVGTVRSRLNRSRAALRTILSRDLIAN